MIYNTKRIDHFFKYLFVEYYLGPILSAALQYLIQKYIFTFFRFLKNIALISITD